MLCSETKMPPYLHDLALAADLLLFICSVISSTRAAGAGDVVAYSFATIDNTTADRLTVVTNQSLVVPGPTLFGIEHPTLSAVNDSAGFVVLAQTVELWRRGGHGEQPALQASFNTSFTMDSSSPVAFVVLLDRFPTYKGTLVGVATKLKPGPGSTVTRGNNSFAAVEIGMVDSYGPPVGLKVTVTPSGAATSLTVWIDYDAVFSGHIGVYVATAGQAKPPSNQLLVRRRPVNLTDRTNQTAFVGFFAARVADLLGGLRGWDLTVERLPAADGENSKKSWLVILLVGLGLVAFTAVVAAAVAFYFGSSKYRRWKKDLEQLAMSMQRLPGMPCQIDYADINKATKDFHSTMELGSGTFGSVYRCRLPAAPEKGRREIEVAVKKFTRDDTRRYDDFLEEVSIINRLRHRNIVPLIGWSYHGGEPLLIFELMPNGSLDQHLFHQKALQWSTRYGIARDIATGLHYVHHEYEPVVLHRDIKASNVLLDSTFRGRLGDFGIACTVALDRNSVTGLAGTRGYIAPEYACSYKATRETDIYAFGVVVLEIVTGRRALDRVDGHMADWVWGLHRGGELLGTVDPLLAAAGFDAEEAERLLLLGLACTSPNPSDRPSMTDAVQVVTKLVPPPDVPLEKPMFVWPPRGWRSLGSLLEENPVGSCCSTEASNLYEISSSTMVVEVSSLEPTPEERPTGT